MILTHRTVDPLLNTSMIGPNTKFEQDGLEQYRKRVTSKELLSSRNSEMNIEDEPQKQEEKPIVVNPKFCRGKSAKSIHKKKVYEESPERINSNQDQNQFRKKNVFTALKKTSLVEKFKNNLFSSAFILRQNQKSQISQYDSKLLEQGNFSKQNLKNKKLKLEKVQKIFGYFIQFFRISQNLDRVKLQMNQFIKNKLNYFYIWEFLQLCMQIFKLLYCPFIISFGKYDHSLKGIEIIIVIFMIFDFAITNTHNLFSENEDEFEISKSNEYKFEVITKFISAIFWILIYKEYYTIYILREIMAVCIVTFLLKTIKLKYERQVERLFLQGFNLDLIDLFTLLITILLFAHLISCSWHYIGDITYQSYGSWLEAYDLIDQKVIVKYIYSFYWATTTIATVGYGDITPKNQIEMIFTIFVMLTSSCMFAYSINQIGLIVNGIYEQNQKQKRSLALLNSYMKNQQIDFKIQNRVRHYLKFSNQKELVDNYEVTQELINQLPIGLQNELKQDVRHKVTKRISLFQNQFSKATNDQVCQSLICLKVTPQDILYHSNDQNERCSYFLSSGEVKIIEEQSKRVLKIAQAGETFGEYQFFTNQNTREAAICNQFAEIYKINRETFLKIVKQNEKDFQRFHKIKDTILFNKDFSHLQKKCETCKTQSHLTVDCPLTRMIPNSYITILKSNYNTSNSRDKFLRNNFKFRSLQNNDQLIQIALQFQDDNDITQYSGFTETINQSEKTLSMKLDDQFITQGNKRESCISYKKNNPKSLTTFSQRARKSMVQGDLKNQIKASTGITIDELQLIVLKENYFANTLENFEKFHTFQEYFPNNNIQNVLKQLNQHVLLQNQKKSFRIKKGRSNFFF